MSYCGECYYEGKKLKPCSTCYCGSEAKTEWTNADRIRAMSDEELADFLLGIDHYWDDGQCIVGFDNAILNDSKSDILEWLQSEAEGE